MIQITTPSNYAYDHAISDRVALKQQKQGHLERPMNPNGDLFNIDRFEYAFEQIVAAFLIFGGVCFTAGLLASDWISQLIMLVFIVGSSGLLTWAYLSNDPDRTKETSHV